ncbi:sugar ABC transporter substrate-binding protein [Anaerocolumna sp. AGMB13025]|uniref:ABC transporter substrate-binding protein n=1 Tax=Anaerocolumna sp. AGMB13025 TaxID=3039116 RepID=UPI00241F770C|nr:sugar ABC transporter substrate-binding protein [Anaerocolumna sp. AGMB13025]WFR55106.1 sugar ABC transporter substrate-binding protein [Anaerocolumna sp. AGMB13025]
MKKVISLLLILTLALGMLSGCGSSKTTKDALSGGGDSTSTAKETQNVDNEDTAKSSDGTQPTESTEPVNIEFWTISLQPTFTDFFNKRIADYEAANPGVTVKWTDLPYESIQEKLVTAVAGGKSPDVVNLNTQMALTLAGKNALVDLNAEATDDQKGIYVESLYESTKIGDSVYAFPWYASPNIMMYNKELFEKAGITEIPTSYQSAFDMAKTMKEKTGAYLYNPPEFFNLLVEEGIPILNEDNTAAAFNTSDTLNLLNAFKTMTDADYLPKTNWGKWDNELKLFETGKLAIISSSGSSLSRIKDEAPDVYEKIGLAKPLTGNIGLSRNALMNVVVPEASKNHEAAINFASYITNDESQLAFCKEVAIFPSTTKAGADSYFVSDQTSLEGQARAMSAQVSVTSKDYSLGVEGQGDIQAEVNKVYEAAITSNKDIQAALDKEEAAVNNILKK